MYEPIRTRPVHSPGLPSDRGGPLAGATVPRQPRAEHLRVQLAGHLAALLAVTDELREDGGSPELDEAAHQIAQRINELSPETSPVRIWEGSRPAGGPVAVLAALHRQAHTIAGRVLLVAASRQDTTTAMLACRRMDAHAAALKAVPTAA